MKGPSPARHEISAKSNANLHFVLRAHLPFGKVNLRKSRQVMSRAIGKSKAKKSVGLSKKKAVLGSQRTKSARSASGAVKLRGGKTVVSTKKAAQGKISAKKPATASPGVISRLRSDFGINQSLLVRMTGYSPRSIVSWGKGMKMTRPASVKFTELHRLVRALRDLIQEREEVVEWLQQPNEAFDGSTPLQVIERGESDRLWRMIYFLQSGEPR